MDRRRLYEIIRHRKVTVSIIILNVLIFFIYVILNRFTNTNLIYEWSINGILIRYFHQYHRLLTSMFMHFDVSHLLLNMLALWILGSFLEAYLKSYKFFILYMASGLISSFVIYGSNVIFEQMNALTAGASGAIYGLMSAILILTFIRNDDFDEQAVRQIRLITLINIILTFALPNISIAGHLGGALGGTLIILLVPKNKKADIYFKEDMYDDRY